MIKKVEINYPNFNGLKLFHTFKEGINLIEEPNGYGKTTLLNTIHSFFTGKFPGLKTLPEGTAEITFSNSRAVLNKSTWIGSISPNELYQYTMPGKFFQLNTREQREILTKLLNLDIGSFILSKIPDWYPDIESDLKAELKDKLSKEEIILEDITRHKSFVINFIEKDFSDIEEYNKFLSVLDKKIDEYNQSVSGSVGIYHKIINQIHGFNDLIKFHIQQVNETNKTIDLFNKDKSCTLCGSGLSDEQYKQEQEKLFNTLKLHQDLVQEFELQKKQQEDLGKLVTNLEYLPKDISSANTLGIDIPSMSKQRLDEYEQYQKDLIDLDFTKRELKIKEDLLKTFHTVNIEKKIESIKEAKKEFTNYLEKAVKNFPIDIELFRVYKNGEIKESFNIKFKGIDYSNLSTGNKTLVQLMLAKIFTDNLGLDFILIDEGGLISKSNLEYIKDLAKNYQVIICKATGWEIKDLIDNK